MQAETSDVDACVDVVFEHWDRPVGVYSHTGVWEQPIWRFIDTITPEDYTELCLGWRDCGVLAIGGCCGIGPEHIDHLEARL